jgi:uncharacterized protein (DUF305 family)
MKIAGTARWILYGMLPVLMIFGIAFAQDRGNSVPERTVHFSCRRQKTASGRSRWETRPDAGRRRRHPELRERHDRGNQKIQDNIISLAQKKGISIEIMLDPLQGQTLDALTREHGAGFDRQYISLMSDEHEKSERLYRKEAEQGQDRDVRAFAGDILPWIQMQLKRAREILSGIPQPFLK